MNIFKLLLKEEIGISERYDIVLFLFIIPVPIIYTGLSLLLDLRNELIDTYILNSILNLFFLSVFCISIVVLPSLLLNFIRKKIPYEKKIIIEEEKTYEVHYFPIFDKIKYYYKSKLHRELGAAIINKNYDNEFYIYGEKVTEKTLNAYKIKHKINKF
jgi:hypothetical protein